MVCNNGRSGKCPALEYVYESNNFLRVFCTRYGQEMGYDQNYKSEAWKFQWHKIVEECDGYDRLTRFEMKPVNVKPDIEKVIPKNKPKKPWSIFHPFGG